MNHEEKRRWLIRYLPDEKAVYACVNYGEAFCPGEIEQRSICINGDICEVFGELLKQSEI